MSRRLSSMKLFFAVLMLCGVHAVFSCSCFPPVGHPQAIFCSSDIVITGKILNVAVPEEQDEDIIYTVKVVKKYFFEGNVGDIITVTSINSGGLCGITHLEKGETYLLTGRKEDDGTYSIAQCRSLVLAETAITPTLRKFLASCRSYCDKCQIQYCGFDGNCGIVPPPKTTCTYFGNFSPVVQCFNRVRCVPGYDGYEPTCGWEDNNC